MVKCAQIKLSEGRNTYFHPPTNPRWTDGISSFKSKYSQASSCLHICILRVINTAQATVTLYSNGRTQHNMINEQARTIKINLGSSILRLQMTILVYIFIYGSIYLLMEIFLTLKTEINDVQSWSQNQNLI